MMIDHYIRYPNGRLKLEASSDVEAIDKAYQFKDHHGVEWIALDRVETTLIFDTRPMEEEDDNVA